MVADKRAGPGSLTHIERLARNPKAHHIFLAMRIIEALDDDAPRLGRARRPRQEKVRFGQMPELAFAGSAIRDFTPPQADRPGRLTNLFFGLFGPHGPLPLHLTEYARDRLRNEDDPTFVAFADMLTHRLMTLLFRAWSTGQAAAAFDRGAGSEMESKVAALSGFMGTAMRDRDAMPDIAKRHFAGLLGQGPRNADGLEAILSVFIRAPVRLEQFVGSWLELEPDDRWQLGGPAGLGHATSIGIRVWTRAAKFRLRIGPLTLTEYERLLPGSPSLTRLTAIVRNYAGDSLDWDVNLILRSDQVPEAILGQDIRLGQTSWIGERSSNADAEDLFLAPLNDDREAA